MQLISRTAFWLAVYRARESQREDRLFHDPFAAPLAGEEGFALTGLEVAGTRVEADNPFYGIRTRFFDDFLLRVVSDSCIRQVVLVAAGLDTRTFRLNWPAGMKVYEIDRAQVFSYKETILEKEVAQPHCTRSCVGVDLLTADWSSRLREAGFEPEVPSVWLAKGFFHYLTDEVVHQIVRQISSLAKEGSWLGADVLNRDFLTSPWTQEWLQKLQELGTPWRYGENDPESFLAHYGWEAMVTEVGREDANYGRWPYPVMLRHMPNVPRTFLVTARRRTNMA